MPVSIKSLGIDRLSVEERLALIEELWDSITDDSSALSVTDAQRAELDRRLDDYEANPDDCVSWEEVRADIGKRLGK